MSIPARLIQKPCAACAVRACAGALAVMLAGPLEAGCQDRPRPGVDWTGCSRKLLMLAGDDLTGGYFNRAALTSSDFRKAKLSNAQLSETGLSYTRFEDADLSRVDLTKAIGWKTSFTLYRPRFVRHRIESYAATAASESWFCRTAAGVWNPCRSMSQVVL
jgi:Pentapeptide repeats (9 copies)